MVRQHFHSREQHVEVRGDDLLERNELGASRNAHETRQQGRHLDAREALLAGRRVAYDDGEVERQVRDVREGMRRIDREWRQHRKDARLELAGQLVTRRFVEVFPVAELNAGFLERGEELFRERACLARDELFDANPYRAQLLELIEAVR